jgi:hypothetical protein
MSASAMILGAILTAHPAPPVQAPETVYVAPGVAVARGPVNEWGMPKNIGDLVPYNYPYNTKIIQNGRVYDANPYNSTGGY